MPGNFIKEDLRSIKTQKSTQNAFTALLERRSFKQITVNDLCEEAFISRSAFYTHYKDKYDLLEGWLSAILTSFPIDVDTMLNVFVYCGNFKMIKNVLDGADSETMGIIHKFAVSCLNQILEVPEDKVNTPEYIVFSNFCIGGVIHHLRWQIKYKFPENLRNTKKYLRDLIEGLFEWRNNNI